jgi:hypothetical protein
LEPNEKIIAPLKKLLKKPSLMLTEIEKTENGILGDYGMSGSMLPFVIMTLAIPGLFSASKKPILN